MLDRILIPLVAALLLELLAFGYFLIKKRQDIADVLWGPAITTSIIASTLVTTPRSNASLLLAILAFVWSSRLSLHIGLRRKGEGEDKRYIELSKTWGKYFIVRSLLQTFLLQGILAFLVSFSIVSFNLRTVGDYTLIPILIGVSIWAFGLVFEAIADSQLKNFIKDPQNKGKIMDRGLWRYSRHPNYFGEIVLWWGIFIITLSTMDLWYLKIIGPLTITVLIIFVSGIPLLEKRYQDNAEYQKYKLRTSSLFPLPPKR